jgi:hypothetical protein
MAMQYRRQQVVKVLRRLGHKELADEALRALPDLIDADWLTTWAIQHGLYKDEVISQMGGSP